MKPILTILLCIGALMTNRSARSDDTASRSSNIYTIGEYGLIEKFDNRFELIKSVHLSDFVRDRHINDAALSPDGNRLLLATTAEMTLMVVETSQLSVLPDIVLQMPRASSGKPERPDPRFVISLVAEEFLYGDFVYSDPLIVNVATGTTMMAPGLKVYNKDAGVVSADGSLIISEFRGMISVYDTRNCKVVYSTRIYPEDDYGWCVKFDVDWKTSELDSLWQMGAPPAGEPVKIHINWESQTIARTNATMPPAVARILTIPGGKDFLHEYVATQLTGGSPRIHGPIKAAIEVANDQSFRNMPAGFKRLFLSKDGRIVAAVTQHVEERDGEKLYGSNIRFLDLKDGNVLRDMTTQEQVVSVLFH